MTDNSDTFDVIGRFRERPLAGEELNSIWGADA